LRTGIETRAHLESTRKQAMRLEKADQAGVRSRPIKDIIGYEACSELARVQMPPSTLLCLIVASNVFPPLRTAELCTSGVLTVTWISSAGMSNLTPETV
jgi:hypothetical protein